MKKIFSIILIFVSAHCFAQTMPVVPTVADNENGVFGFKLDSKYEDIAKDFKLDSVLFSDTYFFYKVDSPAYCTLEGIVYDVVLLFSIDTKKLSTIKISHKGTESQAYKLYLLTISKFGEPSHTFRTSKTLISYDWYGQKTKLSLMRYSDKDSYSESLTFSKRTGSVSRF